MIVKENLGQVFRPKRPTDHRINPTFFPIVIPIHTFLESSYALLKYILQTRLPFCKNPNMYGKIQSERKKNV